MTSDLKASKIVEFLEAAYDFETADQPWVERVMASLCGVWKRGIAVHGGLYDATDLHEIRWSTIHIAGFTPEGIDWLMRGRELISPRMAARNFRHYLVETNEAALPEMRSMNDALAKLGLRNTIYVNSLDPEHLGMLVGLWCRGKEPPPEEDLAVFRRLAHHLAAAYRCRRRLRGSYGERGSIDATEGAAAILDARLRVVHAEGAAKAADERRRLVESAAARDRARTSAREANEVTARLSQFRPLTSAQWTLVDAYELNGTRYIVARENQADVRGVAMLSGRERQAVAYVAAGQSTKETAYALGISANTVRVLLARAAAKLGVKSRAELLRHPDVRKLRPEAELE
jgi:DNA-binding CsgD family transcriptional regulator